jgi:peroxiredoxin family protein
MAPPKNLTMILHSGDLDKAMAAFIVAAGAAAKGMGVTIFFTFWGLNIVKKGGIQKAKLSKMNMGGLGTAMMKKIMRKNNVAPLDELIADCNDLGVRLVACEMTMGIMNVPKEQLVSEVTEIGGVGTYLDAASESNVTLFV